MCELLSRCVKVGSHRIRQAYSRPGQQGHGNYIIVQSSVLQENNAVCSTMNGILGVDIFKINPLQAYVPNIVCHLLLYNQHLKYGSFKL
jgi:hypothetical protein